MTVLSMENPVFRVYLLAAAIMLAKMMSNSWITVYRMMKVKGGFRLPEDAKKTPLNPDPSPDQLLPNEYVERSRRMHQNEVENVPLFLAAGMLWLFAGPSLAVAIGVFGAYVLSRFVHFFFLMTARTHDARATAWTIGSLLIYFMIGAAAWRAVTVPWPSL